MSRPHPVLLMARHLDQGGSERQLAEIAKALDRSRFEAHVGAFRPGGLRWRELESAGVPLVHFPVPSLGSVKGAIEIGRYIHRHGIELVHAFDTPTNLYGVPAARLAGAGVVLSSQRADRELTPRRFRRWLRFTDRLADGIVVNCDFIRRRLVDDEHVPAARIHLCYNGIDLDSFHAVRNGSPPAALRKGSLVVGVVCALRPEKNLETLLEAFADMCPGRPGVKLAVVGSGPCLPDLQTRASELGILEDCIFEPGTSHVACWLRGMDIFVLPSLTEALSNSLMEAMACGCCVVASRVGGNPELVTDGETGVLFERRDRAGLARALARLVDQPSWRAALASNAACFIREKFRLEASARRMEEIYTTLLARN